MNPTITIKVCEKDLRSATVSPDGSKVASTNKEGVLYVHDLSSGQLIGGFKVDVNGTVFSFICCSILFCLHFLDMSGLDCSYSP